MNRYTASGITAATAATIDHAIASLWNPSSTKRIYVKEIHLAKTTAGAADIPRVTRITARGTAGSTITPSIVHDHDNAIAPSSGALLDLAAFSVQPTLSALRLHSFVTPGSIGSGLMWVFDEEITIPAGAGLALTVGSALAYPVSPVTYSWRE